MEKTTTTTDVASARPSQNNADDSNDNHQLNADSGMIPPLHFRYFKTWTLVGYITFLIVCNVLVPCLLFYLLETFTKFNDQELIGVSSSALGLSSCIDSPVRLFRLIRFRKEYGPLNDDKWWHLDFFMWLYTWMLFIFTFPLAIAPAVPVYDFFLMATPMLVGACIPIFLFTLYPRPLPVFYFSSDPPMTVHIKPAIFYILEDLGAVDFKHGRTWRRQCHARYAASEPFRQLMRNLTWFLTWSIVFYFGISAAVTWGAPLHFAFGWVLGQFFIWAGFTAIGFWIISKKALKREKIWWEAKRGPASINHGDPEKTTGITNSS